MEQSQENCPDKKKRNEKVRTILDFNNIIEKIQIDIVTSRHSNRKKSKLHDS